MNRGGLKKGLLKKQVIPAMVCFIISLMMAENALGQNVPDSLTNKEISCEDSLWNHVFMKYRLKVIQRCKRVTGVITATKKSGDGDVHFLLKLDPGQGDLLNNKNMIKQEGCLVIEPICVTAVYNFFVGKACKGYVNKVYIPKVGEHVEVIGSLVKDGVHGWHEIHPVTKITVIKN
jgi:hypothetical protein